MNRLVEKVQMRGHNICSYTELTKIILNYHQITPSYLELWSDVNIWPPQLITMAHLFKA